MHIYMLCENSDSVRNKNPKSLQVILCVCVFIHAHVRFVKTLQVVQAQSLCVCVCVCVCVHVCVHMCIHSCTYTLCKDSVRNNNPKSLQALQAQSVCVCVCVCVCACMCVSCVRAQACTFMHLYTLCEK